MTKRTFASVTTVSCTCRYLQDQADEPNSPICFDSETNEYHFAWNDRGLVIYHCPFCGGVTPESKRDKLFADVSDAEQLRLGQLLDRIDSIDGAIIAFGKPDYDGFVNSQHRDEDGESPKLTRQRCLRYERLSETAYVLITEIAGGKVRWQLQGKYVG